MQLDCNMEKTVCDWMQKMEEMDILFSQWRQKHSDDNSELTKYDFVSKNSFTVDGPIVPELYYNAPKRILLVGKEPNVSGTEKNGDGKAEANGGFYVQESVLCTTQNGHKFVTPLAKIYNAIITGDFDRPNSSLEGLRYAAFMNLNKRGGPSECDPKVLMAYSCKFQELIAQEIALLDPHLIVCCGAQCYRIVTSEIKSQIKGIPILSVFHPSYRRSDKVKLERIKNELNKFTDIHH